MHGRARASRRSAARGYATLLRTAWHCPAWHASAACVDEHRRIESHYYSNMSLMTPQPEPEPELEQDEQRKVICYRCGQPGHVRLDCPNPENPCAVAALQEFRKARKQRRKEQQRQNAKQPKQRDCTRIARSWLAGRGVDECGGDPVALVMSRGTNQLKRDLAAAAKDHFDRGIVHVASQLARENASLAEQHASAGEALATALRGALRDGVPPDFGDAAALTVCAIVA